MQRSIFQRWNLYDHRYMEQRVLSDSFNPDACLSSTLLYVSLAT